VVRAAKSRSGAREALAASIFFLACPAPAETPAIPQPLESGIEYASDEVRALQADDFSNPGMLWVDRGARLWRAPAGAAGKSCASCHGDAASSMKGVATRYPRIDPGAARVVDLEGRINLCRRRNQRAEPLDHEADDLLGLAAFVAHQSRGMPVAVEIDWQNRTSFERGRRAYHTRIGQMNLSCSHCHDRNWGKRLGRERISQGHGNAYPAYRLEWQTLGSLQRRIRACFFGVRAEMPPYDAAELLDLELYLGWRGNGLLVETPGVRR
jgi:sulfur-oxidizing protein SoxA